MTSPQALRAVAGRPKRTVAHQVSVLAGAGLVKVVRRRRVRAIDERFHGRTTRIFHVGAVRPGQAHELGNYPSCPGPISGITARTDRVRP